MEPLSLVEPLIALAGTSAASGGASAATAPLLAALAARLKPLTELPRVKALAAPTVAIKRINPAPMGCKRRII
jgi:hypothetical protein